MDCENFTSGTESKVTAGMFAPARERLKIRGKRGRLDRPKFPTSIFVDGKEVSVRLPIDQTHPTMLLLPQLYGPALLVGRNSSLSGFAGVWLHGFFENEDVPHKRFAAPAIDLLSYCQMLAKIAHSFATAAVGLGVFEPLLVEFIRRRHARTAPMDMWAYELIGGVETPFTPSDALHELVLGTAPHLSQTYLCVTIRLFALLAGPIYTVLVGPLRPGVTVDDVGRLAAQRAPL